MIDFRKPLQSFHVTNGNGPRFGTALSSRVPTFRICTGGKRKPRRSFDNSAAPCGGWVRKIQAAFGELLYPDVIHRSTQHQGVRG